MGQLLFSLAFGVERLHFCDIRRKTSTPTLKSLLYTRYINQICTWGNSASFARLSEKTEIDNELKTFGIEIKNFIDWISSAKDIKCICNSHNTCDLHSRLCLYTPSGEKNNFAQKLIKIQNVEIRAIKLEQQDLTN